MDDHLWKHLGNLAFTPDGGVDADAVRVLEQDLGVSLPDDYRSFLTEAGGGGFGVSVGCRCINAPPIAAGGLSPVDFFLGPRGEESIAVVASRAEAVEMRAGLLPIVLVLCGDYYCLELESGGAPVVYWDHDSGEDHVVATSFSDFIARLEPDPDGTNIDLSQVTIELDPDLLS